MGDSLLRSVDCAAGAPAIGRIDFAEMMQASDVLLALMGSEPLDVVADLATSLTGSANDAGALEIAEAANTVRRIASAHKPVALAGAMHDLTAAIARARSGSRLES